jgi:hypothetical protein
VIDDLVSLYLRKAILRRRLQMTRWNLTHCAEALRLPDAAAVRREIKRLGLSDAYEDARKRGAVKAGGHKVRAPDDLTDEELVRIYPSEPEED